MTQNHDWLDPIFWERISIEDMRQIQANAARVDTRDLYGATPLHIAVAWSNVSVTRILIEAGADVNASDENGITPIHVAARSGKTEVVRALLEAGADVNAQAEVEREVTLDLRNGRAKDKTTALHMAARESNVETVRVLLEAGADTNARTRRGLTPLHYAAIWGSIETARLLLDSGSDATARDKTGLTPLAYASKTVRGMMEIEVGDQASVSSLADDNRNIMLYWDDAPPPDVSDIVKIWQNRCPSWKVKLFNQGTACKFIRDVYGGEIARFFLSCAVPAMRADFFRVFWGLAEGGIYSDVRFIPVHEPMFFDAGKNLTVIRSPDGIIRNNIFFTKKNCKELKLLAYEILRNVSKRQGKNIAAITGPIAWRRVLWPRETSTMGIVDWEDIYGKFLTNSNYISCTRGKDTHWSRIQKHIEIYCEPQE